MAQNSWLKSPRLKKAWLNNLGLKGLEFEKCGVEIQILVHKKSPPQDFNIRNLNLPIYGNGDGGAHGSRYGKSP